MWIQREFKNTNTKASYTLFLHMARACLCFMRSRELPGDPDILWRRSRGYGGHAGCNEDDAWQELEMRQQLQSPTIHAAPCLSANSTHSWVLCEYPSASEGTLGCTTPPAVPCLLAEPGGFLLPAGSWGAVKGDWCYVVVLHHLENHPLQTKTKSWSKRVCVVWRWWSVKDDWLLHWVP